MGSVSSRRCYRISPRHHWSEKTDSHRKRSARRMGNKTRDLEIVFILCCVVYVFHDRQMEGSVVLYDGTSPPARTSDVCETPNKHSQPHPLHSCSSTPQHSCDDVYRESAIVVALVKGGRKSYYSLPPASTYPHNVQSRLPSCWKSLCTSSLFLNQ